MPSDDFETCVPPVLDEAGFSYRRETAADGSPYAACVVQAKTGRPISMTVQLRDRVLSIRAHDLVQAPPYCNDLWLYNEVNQDWCTGCVYYRPERGAYSARIELPLPDLSLTPSVFKLCAAHLSEASLSLEQQSVPFLPLPPRATGNTVEAAAQAAAEAGVAFQAQGPVLRGLFKDEDGDPFQAEIYESDERFLHLRCFHHANRTVPANDESIRCIHELNGRIGLGKVALLREQSRTYYLCTTVLGWTPIGAFLLTRMMRQAAWCMRRLRLDLKA
jgi:hypothetical protein